MDVVGGHHIIQNLYSEALFCFKKPPDPRSAVPGKPEQKFPLVTAVGDMPDIAWKEVTVRPRHGWS
jgi:hypothetical protein